ncbi:MAG: hypothetical protein NDJ90_11010 [Oligoflexia bacterium]|nr:hypothetical protein [Oligoflexia bacterium]
MKKVRGSVLGSALVAATVGLVLSCAPKATVKQDLKNGEQAKAAPNLTQAAPPSVFELAHNRGALRLRPGFQRYVAGQKAPKPRRGRSPASVEAPVDETPRVPRGATALQPNSIRYREKGAKPGTGRAGTATLSTRALMGKDKTTVLEVTTGMIDSPTTAVGSLAKVQLKLLNSAGKTLSTRVFPELNSGAYLKFNFSDLGRGQPLRVQANVTGVDGARTSVVTVNDTVYLRPDLKIEQLTVPASASVDTPVNISATVRELNFDVGAQANCVLYVNGVEADRASAIWVDAGGFVSCAFTKVFTTAGARQLQVKVEETVPADYDVANNAVSGSVEIVAAGTPIPYTALVDDYAFTFHQKSEGFDLYNDGSFDSNSAYSYVTDNSGWEQRVLLTAESFGHSAGFPLSSIMIVEKNDGAVVNTVNHNALPADYTYDLMVGTDRVVGGCAQALGAQNSTLSVCSQRRTNTASGSVVSQNLSVDYRRMAGDVIYRSTGYERYWSAYYGTDNYYTINETNRSTSGTRVALGSQYVVDLKVVTGAADFAVVPMISLQPLSEASSTPYGCSEWSSEISSMRYCFEQSQTLTGKRGTAIFP